MGRRIAIDPGHGGGDAGAVGKRTEEKKLNLELGAELFSRLLSLGHDPLLLRSGDYNMKLSKRVKNAGDWSADLFISLHHNGFHCGSARGCETFFYPGSKKGEKLAEEIQTGLIRLWGMPDRGIKKSKRLYVLRKTAMPAVLVEPLFVTNSCDEEILLGADYFSETAGCLAQKLHCIDL
ncbi:N-acetylmuramoyl-L-alanine amidase family protein [Halarsenatibacter silvermanii]|uniref:N-acetylmuramoyl-L-alanine amidase n=1 Tax=Halarsenatibacter silvermanii TaxID=321763 RepID=A0A1G9MVE6_9FIRM|nr:N-acetylmuramoyl-L-alanine amidase [Halarsenatibacter silvermanii]SDL78103.1 N-acetylmuramoyl-L-alanine amidase [Halarsenatibacter silvermanii]